jgi:hypothetical protein
MKFNDEQRALHNNRLKEIWKTGNCPVCKHMILRFPAPLSTLSLSLHGWGGRFRPEHRPICSGISSCLLYFVITKIISMDNIPAKGLELLLLTVSY